MSIISFDRTNARNRACWAQRYRALAVQLLSRARHYYLAPTIIIDRPSLLLIVHHCYRSSATVIDRGATPIESTTY
ncbi:MULTISPECIES: hypothetical protein [unclassified Microcoleus]|uniref:hypothetical protein n=1 Tax=unclassified Microcoleus TaxID=2642155 RepID=UPI002FD69DBF